MNMVARFDDNPAMTLEDIKETKRYGRTDTRTHARTDNVKTVYPPQTKFAGGISKILMTNGTLGNNASDHPQHPGGNSFYCCPERDEIVV